MKDLIRYKVVQAMPGTDGYGWFILILGTDGKWYNFFGNRPKANETQIRIVTDRLDAKGYVRQ